MKNKKINLKYLFLIIPIGLILVLSLTYLANKNQIDDEINWMMMKEKQKLNVPLENQLPDLPNGCEVTSLSMLMNYYGIKVTKNELAQSIQHVDSFTDNGRYRGNPNQGFVQMPAGAFIMVRFITLHVNTPTTSLMLPAVIS